ncbi:zinc/iron permease [Hymenobacter caeli]|uniref:Zinc transporter ZupT n=1 Tax=Hymenobacter caeli TaxID=2735894 RepID=A0ABX2FQT6_9BACT|nr:zinc/iron permease [Hymenobacter caeli]NRT18797.1 zinc transporter ZupT [Hymenobacter caeli]
MWIAIFVLLGTVLAAGWAAGRVPAALGQAALVPLLAFSGAYLFTLTVTHLLPEAWQLVPGQGPRVGYWVLAGFFGQVLLEVFSQGVEHGHVHPAGARAGRVPLLLLAALAVHSFLEGSILVPAAGGAIGSAYYAVVAGVALHHIPAAFALATLLHQRPGPARAAWPGLLLFALAGPAGILSSNYLVLHERLGAGAYAALLGLVAGNFLHVSTTILFENSPGHRLNWAKLGATAVGATLALAIA